MPNTGKPSKDCHLCRSRRVKCDLARPHCLRCKKYGVECPGYRDQQELVFRNMNPTTVRKKKKTTSAAPATAATPSQWPDSDCSQPQTPIGLPLVLPSGTFEQLFSDPCVLDEVDSSEEDQGHADALMRKHSNGYNTVQRRYYDYGMPECLSQHWTAESVPMLVNIYSSLSLLQNMYRTHTQDGPLIWAAHLFTRTYVTNIRSPTAVARHSRDETSRELGTYMGKTLASVSQALQEPEGALRNDVLATVWILSNYELLVGSLEPTHAASPWHLHCAGLSSILKSRGLDTLRTEEGRIAFWPAYGVLQIQALVTTTECPPEAEMWLNTIRDSVTPDEAFPLALATFVMKVARIQSEITRILRRRHFDVAAQKYVAWTTEFADAELEMDTFLSTYRRQCDWIDDYMLSMRDAALVKGRNIVVLLVNFLTNDPQCSIPREELVNERDYSMKRCRKAADTILDCVPNVLHPIAQQKNKSPRIVFESIRLIWPLHSVRITTGTSAAQKVRAESLLRFMGSEIGIRQGLKRYSHDVRMPEELWEPKDLPRYEEV